MGEDRALIMRANAKFVVPADRLPAIAATPPRANAPGLFFVGWGCHKNFPIFVA